MMRQRSSECRTSLIPVDLNIVGCVIHGITRTQHHRAVLVYLDCLRKCTVSFQEINTSLNNIFGPISEKDLFIRSDNSHKESDLHLLNGSCFIIIQTEISLDGDSFKEEIQRQKLQFGSVPIKAVLQDILYGNILMFSEGMHMLNLHLRQITQLKSVDLPELCSDELIKLGQFTFSSLYNVENSENINISTSTAPSTACGAKRPGISILTPILNLLKDKRKEKIRSINIFESSSKKIIGPLKEKKKKKSKLDKLIPNSLCEPVLSLTPDKTSYTRSKPRTRTQSTTVEAIKEKPKKKTRAKKNTRLMYEKARERLASARKRGSSVIAIEGTPPGLTFGELRRLFDVSPKLSPDCVVFLKSSSLGLRGPREIRLYLDSQENFQQMLSLHSCRIKNCPLKVRMIFDLDQHAIWLEDNHEDIRIFS